jgi:hypothetical protein
MSASPAQPAAPEVFLASDAEPAAAWMPELLDRSSRLIEAAARRLGLSASAAAEARRSAMLSAGNKRVLVLPVAPTESGGVALLISVQTRVPVVGPGGSHQTLAVLQQAQGALYASAAAIGATPEGWWVVHRMVRVEAGDDTALAGELRESVGLVEHLLRGLVPLGH